MLQKLQIMANMSLLLFAILALFEVDLNAQTTASSARGTTSSSNTSNQNSKRAAEIQEDYNRRMEALRQQQERNKQAVDEFAEKLKNILKGNDDEEEVTESSSSDDSYDAESAARIASEKAENRAAEESRRRAAEELRALEAAERAKEREKAYKEQRRKEISKCSAVYGGSRGYATAITYGAAFGKPTAEAAVQAATQDGLARQGVRGYTVFSGCNGGHGAVAGSPAPAHMGSDLYYQIQAVDGKMSQSEADREALALCNRKREGDDPPCVIIKRWNVAPEVAEEEDNISESEEAELDERTRAYREQKRRERERQRAAEQEKPQPVREQEKVAAFAYYKGNVVVNNKLMVTIYVEPQQFSHGKGDTFLFAPPEVQKRAEQAVKTYLNQLDPSGKTASTLVIAPSGEHALVGDVSQANQKLVADMQKTYQQALAVPLEMYPHRIVLLNTAAGTVTKSVEVPKAPSRSTRGTRRAN